MDTIVCKQCGAGVLAEDVNLDHMIAKCRRCNAVFDISSRVSTPHARRRPLIGLPAHIRVTIDDRDVSTESDYRSAPGVRPGTFAVVRRWFEPAKHLPLLLFLVLWDGFLVMWYRTAMQAPTKDASALLFPILHVAAGLFLTYSVIAGFFNTTRIAIENEQLVIRHSPIPWPGNRVLATSSIQQLFTEEKVSSSRNRVSRTYDLSAILQDGQRIKLLRGLSTADQALFMEQAIEDRLGLVDTNVAGEMAHPA